MVDIPSGTANAAGVERVGAVFRSSFDSLGFTTRLSNQDSVKRGGHLIAVHKGKAGRARLLLIGHLDTVFEGEGHAWRLGPGDSTAQGAVGPNDPVQRGAGAISFVAALVGGSLDGLGGAALTAPR